MDRQYIGEETGAVWGTKVKYLDEVERKKYQLHIKEGKLYDANGNLYDTSNSKTAFSKDNAIFVMDKDGLIYASKTHSPGEFHHSSFLSGKPVASAGEISVKNGILQNVTRKSGHYKPTAEQSEQFIDKLKSVGVKTNKIKTSGGF